MALLALCPDLSCGRPARANCTNPAGVETNMVYNKDYRAYQFCDGTNWKPMGSAHAFGSGGCSNPAGVEKAIIYNV
jgi:hypothetical protein